jgi:hypothetical protein
MKHQIFALAVAALSFTACTNEDNISQDFLADTPIKLNVSVDEPTTRAGYSNDDKPTGFVLVVQPSDNENDKYNYEVWAEWEDKNWKTYKLNQYYDYTTGKVTGIKEEVTMLWANMKDNVTVLAISDVDYLEKIDKHPTDQTTPDALKKADFLAMPITKVKPTQSGINVEFKHTMSKINLTISWVPCSNREGCRLHLVVSGYQLERIGGGRVQCQFLIICPLIELAIHLEADSKLSACDGLRNQNRLIGS